MDILNLALPGLLLIKPKVWRDERGYFVETWQQSRYREAGVPGPFVQDNHSHSLKGILRGLHFQKQHPQGKLIHVSRGSVFDVAVDIRPGSPTFGKWHGEILSEENQHQLWVPAGMAHGFCVLEDHTDFYYKCTEVYRPDDEGSIRWNDPDIGIKWPVKAPTVSAKDAIAPFWKEVAAHMA